MTTYINSHPIGFFSALLALTVSQELAAIESCGDFGECKTLIEVNATDGDIGFHFLIDGDDLNSVRLNSPDNAKIFEDIAKGTLLDQKLTETFVESAEPLCWASPDADPEDEIVTLPEFLERWPEGTYYFSAKGDQGEKLEGETSLSHALPAAPVNLDFDGSLISWSPGNDLGNCGSDAALSELVSSGILPIHPASVMVNRWEVVLEPEEHPGLRFSVQLPASQLSVSVPWDYLSSLPDDTLTKIEIGAIAADDNATFSEIGEICINEVNGCELDLE